MDRPYWIGRKYGHRIESILWYGNHGEREKESFTEVFTNDSP